MDQETVNISAPHFKHTTRSYVWDKISTLTGDKRQQKSGNWFRKEDSFRIVLMSAIEDPNLEVGISRVVCYLASVNDPFVRVSKRMVAQRTRF